MQLILPIKTIKVDVDYYNATEREKLLKYPTATAIAQIVDQTIDIPTAEFLTYYLFHRKKLRPAVYADYASIGHKIDTALTSLSDCIEFGQHSIRTPSDVVAQLNEVSEHIGEAIGLSVISRVHQLTDADWSPIPQQHGAGAKPTLDFQIAADGHRFVEVETKGSSVANNRVRTAAVQQHKHNIISKKEKQESFASSGEDSHAASTRYGTITVLDPRSDSIVKCWLLDPDPELVPSDPRRFRLLMRMRFLRDWISFISPRSLLATALATRVADLEHMNDPFELDQVPLLRGSGEPFYFTPYDTTGQHTPFLLRKSRIVDGPAGGIVMQLPNENFYLLGIQEQLLVTGAEQSFSDIMTLRLEAGTIEKTVRCVFTPTRFRRLRLPDAVRSTAQVEDRLAAFELTGPIHYSRSGLVFGELPIPKGTRPVAR